MKNVITFFKLVRAVFEKLLHVWGEALFAQWVGENKGRHGRAGEVAYPFAVRQDGLLDQLLGELSGRWGKGEGGINDIYILYFLMIKLNVL